MNSPAADNTFPDAGTAAWLRVTRLRRCVPVISAFVVIVTSVVLAGWAWAGEATQSRLAAVFIMKVNTVIGVMLVAVAQFGLWTGTRRWRVGATFAAALALSIAFSVLAEYAFGQNFKIDQLLFHDYAGVRYPGRTSVGSAFCIGLLSVATLLAISDRTTAGSQVVFFYAAGIPLLAFGGTLFRAPGLSSMTSVPIVSVQSSICQVLLCLGGLFLKPDRGPMRLVVSDSAAGSVTRRLLPLSMALPVLAGLLILLGEAGGLYSTQFGSSLLVSCCAIVFASAVWTTGSLLWKTERGNAAEQELRQQAEGARRESETAFRQLADSMPQIVWAARPDGTVDYYNRRWYEYTGVDPDLTGDPSWMPVIHPDDLPRIVVVWHESLRTGLPYELESRYRRSSDGAFRWHLSRALPGHDSDGRIFRWYGTNTDIHDQKQLRDERGQLLAAERASRADAEAAGKVKDEFLATLSHELRTPLNAILGWTQILRLDPVDTASTAEGLEVIERNARAQTQIIGDILDMSRIVSGKLRLELRPAVDLAPHVAAAVATVKLTADAKSVRVSTDVAPGVAVIDADPDRLHQIFWNLLSNAVKFTPRGGTVRVGLDSADGHVRVSVVDTGEGIDPSFLPHVFDRFRQADASTTRRHGGLGLGLAIVKQLVELHGGSIGASSEGTGRGATFVVTLPLSAAKTATGKTTSGMTSPDKTSPGETSPEQISAGPDRVPRGGSSTDLAGVSVVAVDDEPDGAELIRRLLVTRGATVRTAHSAADGFRLIVSDPPDVLVSDIGMPVEDGYDLLRRLRSMPSHVADIPAVAVTAYARESDRVKALEAGFAAHLTKPVDPTDLNAVVTRLANQPPGRVAPSPDARPSPFVPGTDDRS